MVQTAVPVARVAELEEVYGKGLEGMSEKLFGRGRARVEVGGSVVEKVEEGGSGGDGGWGKVGVRSVLHSGTFSEVEKIWQELRVGRNNFAMKNIATATPPPPPPTIRPHAASSTPTLPTWAQKPILPRSTHPTTNLHKFAHILRARSADSTHVTTETLVPRACFTRELWDESTLR